MIYEIILVHLSQVYTTHKFMRRISFPSDE